MNEASDLVTRLVVGERLTIELGRPVTEDREGTLQLQGGRWVASGAAVQIAELLARVRRPAPSAQGSLIQLGAAAAEPASPSRELWRTWILPVTAALTVVLAIVSLAGYWRSGAGGADRGTATSAAEQPRPVTQAVTVVHAPYDPAAPALPLAPAGALIEPAPASPVPPQIVAAAAQPPAPPAPPAGLAGGPATQAARPPVSSASAPGRDDKPRPSAVLVDEAPAPASSVSARPAVATPLAAAQAPGAKPASAPAVTASPGKTTSGPALPRGTGLVAITPDGKSAVFTNPKTRMPEQFRVGDQLPSGETLKSIDQKEGRVLTGAKEYTLD